MMQESEFPRGGTQTPDTQTAQAKPATDHLFKISTTEQAGKKKSKKSKKKAEDICKDEILEASITSLARKSLVPGTLLLGIVAEIHEYSLHISLPCGLSGSVEVTGISQAYSDQLQGMVAGDLDCDPAPLSKIFVVGQMVPCSVVKVTPRLMLTLNPTVVNKDLRPAHLHPGKSLVVAVQSIEDHGYVLETGVPSLALGGTLAGFIPLSASSSLAVGQLVECQVLKPPEGRSVKLGFAPSKPEPVPAETPMVALLPGNVVKFIITKVEAQGIHGQVGSTYICAHRHHCWHDPSQYTVGNEEKGTVLYIHDFTRQVYVRLGRHEVSAKLKAIQPGQDLEGKVQSITQNSLYLKLPQGVKAFATKNLLVDGEEDFEIPKKFPQGSTHKCRVLSVDLVDRMVKVTLKPSALRKPYINYQAIKVGDYFKQAKVEEHKKYGLVVRFDAHLTGIIRNPFLADHPVSKPEERFPVGSKLPCRVLEVKPTVNLPRVLLTSQKSWLSWSGKVPQSLEDLQPSKDLPGTVVQVTPKGLLVVTFAGIQGWVPPTKTGVAKIESHFNVGQSVRLTLVTCDENSRLIFSLIKKKEKPKPNPLQTGELVDRARVTGSNTVGLELEMKGGYRALLPAGHLSDHLELCQPLLKVMKEAGTISNLRCFRGGIRNPVLTRKASFLSTEKLDVAFGNLSLGQVLPGVVRGSTPFSTFIELGGGFVAMANNKDVGAGQTEVGKSIEVHITELDEEKEQAKVSLRLTAVWQQGHAEPSVQYLASYLEDLRVLPGPHPGTVVPVTVDSLSDGVSKCSLENGREGLATVDDSKKPGVSPGSTAKALVLASHPDLELCLDNSVVRKVVNAAEIENQSQAVKEGQLIKCHALSVQPKYVLVLLGGHANGKLAFIPTMSHPNDVVGRGKLYVVGDHYHIVVKKVTDNFVIGVLKQHDKDLQARTKAKKEKETKIIQQQQKKKRKAEEENTETSSPAKKKPKKEEPKCEIPLWTDSMLFQIPDPDEAMQESDTEEEMEEEEPQEENTAHVQSVLAEESALKWLQRMAEAMDRGDVAQARSEGRQGLQTAKLDKDQIDLWLALVNLELLQDLPDAAEAIVQEALQHCEPLPLLTGLLRVYNSSGHKELAHATADMLVRKCRNQKQAWLQALQYYMTSGDIAAAQALKHRCQPCLTKKEYVEVLTKLGQLEFQYGDPEQGKTMMETVLACIPGRADVGALYIQLLAKHGHLDYARQFATKLDSMPLAQKKKDALRQKLNALLATHKE